MRNAVKMSPKSTLTAVDFDHFLYYPMYSDFHLRMPNYTPNIQRIHNASQLNKIVRRYLFDVNRFGNGNRLWEVYRLYSIAYTVRGLYT